MQTKTQLKLGLIGIAVIIIQQFFLTKKTSKTMNTVQDFQTALDRIDNATNNIAQELKDLKDEVAGGGLSAEAEASVLSKLDAAASKLEGIGSSDAAPAPVTEPTPTDDSSNASSDASATPVVAGDNGDVVTEETPQS